MKKGSKSLRKINESSRVVSMRIECGNCKWRFTEDVDKLTVMAYDEKCETCGSHGGVDVNVTCPMCSKNLTISVRSW